MTDASPWKRLVTAALCLACGLKLIAADWTVAGLVDFVALIFVAVGALRLVTTPTFDGLAGAVALLGAGGDLAVGAALLAWPGITLFVMATIAGGWVAFRSVAAATIIVATRADRRAWVFELVVTVAELALGILVMARAGAGHRATALIVGAIAVLDGARELSRASAREEPHGAETFVLTDTP